MRYEFIKIVNIELFMKKKKKLKIITYEMTCRGKGEKEENVSYEKDTLLK